MNNHYLLVEIPLLIFPGALACYENDKKDRAPDFRNDTEAGYCDGQFVLSWKMPVDNLSCIMWNNCWNDR